MKKRAIKKINTRIFGYWLDTFVYIEEIENEIDLFPFPTISIKIEKKLVAAILGFFLNFTIFIPVSSANQRNNKFNDEIVQYIASTNFNKIVKETPRKKIRFSKKKARKLKQLNEQRLRIILLKKYFILNSELKKLNPSLFVFKNNNGLKACSLTKPVSQKQAEILLRIKNRSIRAGVNLDDSKSENKSSSNISSLVLKKYINKLIQKFEFVAEWIQNNPTIFSLGIIANVSLIYLYQNGYFLEWYNLIRNSSPRFLDLAQKFNHLFEEENSPFQTFYERVRAMDPDYFSQENNGQTEFSFFDLKTDEKIVVNSTTLSVEEEPNLFSSTQELEREPSLEDYSDHWQIWEKIIQNESGKDKNE
jgi:hypothetical protein